MGIIGITGNSGSGKSAVSKIIKEKINAYLIDADEIAKNLTENKKEYLDEIIKEFGNDIVNKKGKLNRPKLANIIYNNIEKRKMLNNITFKYINEEIKVKVNDNKNRYKYILVDAPLLFESKLDECCDFTIGVIADTKVKIDRLIKRDGLSIDEAKDRLKAQNSNEFFIQNCTYVINNNFNTINELEENINKFIEKILQ